MCLEEPLARGHHLLRAHIAGPHGDTDLWALIALSHPQRPHPNKQKALAHSFEFTVIFCPSLSFSM